MKFISFNNFENNLNNNSNVGMGILTAIAVILFAISIFGLIGNFILWEPVSLWFLRVCSLPIIIMLFVGHINYRIEAKKGKLILQEPVVPIDTKSLTRVEVISTNGRIFSNMLKDSYYRLSLQDDGRTLKFFETTKDK